jgi:hypothetical protein
VSVEFTRVSKAIEKVSDSWYRTVYMLEKRKSDSFILVFFGIFSLHLGVESLPFSQVWKMQWIQSTDA